LSKRTGLLPALLLVISLLLAACNQGAAAPTPTSAPAATATTAAPANTPAAAAVPTSTTAPATPTTAPATPTTAPAPTNPDVILATTTSTRDSGLLDVLLPDFKARTGYNVKPIAVGTGAALQHGERGDADVLLVHAPASEKKYMDGGHGVERMLVMHNDFVIVGPEDDAAGIGSIQSAAEALKAIADQQKLFISRGDNSGTHQLEKQLWTKAGMEPSGSWYQEAGQGMGETLRIASEKEGYTVTDRGTYLALKDGLALEILVEGDAALLNIYSVITVNPNKNDKINAEGGKAFADYMVSSPAQAIIKDYGVDKYGQPLFFPDADKTYEQLESGG
jgi:tungstate transport system substrate-binding protein